METLERSHFYFLSCWNLKENCISQRRFSWVLGYFEVSVQMFLLKFPLQIDTNESPVIIQSSYWETNWLLIADVDFLTRLSAVWGIKISSEARRHMRLMGSFSQEKQETPFTLHLIVLLSWRNNWDIKETSILIVFFFMLELFFRGCFFTAVEIQLSSWFWNINIVSDVSPLLFFFSFFFGDMKMRPKLDKF